MPIPKRRRLAAALGGVVVLTIALSGLLSPRPAPRYTVADVGVLPGYAISDAMAVDSQGDVTGSMTLAGSMSRYAYLSQGGRLTNLGVLPGGSGSDAYGMNSRGEVTGVAWLPTGSHAFLYSRGRMRDLGTLPGFRESGGKSINDKGEIAGNVSNLLVRPGLPHIHALLYSHGRMTDLGTLPSFSGSEAQSINSAGQVAGVCYSHSGRVRCAPFLYDSRRKTMKALPLPAPYRWGYVYRVNEHGQVAGNISASGKSLHAALWDGGRMTDLGTPPGYTSSNAQGLNNQGEAVGWCFSNYSATQIFLRNHVTGDNALRRYLDRDMEHAFVYRDGKMQDLNELIPRDSDWTLENARGINDRGQIVGQGLHHGQTRGFLLTPR